MIFYDSPVSCILIAVRDLNNHVRIEIRLINYLMFQGILLDFDQRFIFPVFSLQTPHLEYHTGYKLSELSGCVRALNDLLKKPQVDLSSVRCKYSHE